MKRHTVDTCNREDPQDNCVFFENSVYDPVTGWPNLVSVVKVCSRHQGLLGQALYSIVIEEQKRRTRVLTMAQAIKPDITWDDFVFQYTPQGVLKCLISKFTSAQKTTLQQSANLSVGLAKIEVG